MKKARVVIIGGGATGIGILRDLAMRGVDVLLIEKRDFMNGASSRYHGLLHSGCRYAVTDKIAAEECITENKILRKIGKACVEITEGMFTRLDVDDENYEMQWVRGCAESGIEVKQITLEEAFNLEPRLSRKNLKSVYLVPDAAIDGFRMARQNIDSAKRYGARAETYTALTNIIQKNGEVQGIKVKNYFTGEESEIECEILVNAGGGWAGEIAKLAGLEINVQPDKGTLIAFNQRITNHVVNRLHKSSDGDIFVPHGSITILGTTSMSVPSPEDTSSSRAEIEKLLSIGEMTFENLRDYRILRAFAGSRPLYIPKGSESGRGASRGFAVINHAVDGLKNFFTIVGGKFTTYRLMAEKISDQICKQLNITTPCRTAEEELVPEVKAEDKKSARKFFPAYGVELAANRLGAERFSNVVKRLEAEPAKRELLCECENVTAAEAEEICRESTTFTLNDLRRRTRIGMGTCQANFCAFRSANFFSRYGFNNSSQDNLGQMKEFLQERWKGVRSVLVGNALREIEMTRAIYELSLNLHEDGK